MNLWEVIIPFFYGRRIIITNSILLLGTDFGVVYCSLKNVMDNKHIGIYKLGKITGLKYDVIMRYYRNQITKYDAIVLAKLCYALDCSISDLLKYEV